MHIHYYFGEGECEISLYSVFLVTFILICMVADLLTMGSSFKETFQALNQVIKHMTTTQNNAHNVKNSNLI